MTEIPPINAGNNLIAKIESPVTRRRALDKKAVKGGTDKYPHAR
jgi:hypothetical protein